MRTMLIVVTVCALTFVFRPVAAEANLLLDPSFEGLTNWWGGASGEAGAWHWENNANARSGNDLVAIGFWGAGGSGYWGQNVGGLAQGDAFDFTVYAKTETGFSGTVYLKVEFQDASDSILLAVTNSGVSGDFTSWQQLSFSTEPAPENTAKANFMMYVEGTANSAMFDDADVAVIPEPGSLALLGAALVALTAMRRRRK